MFICKIVWEKAFAPVLNEKTADFPHGFVPKPQRTMAKLEFEFNLAGLFNVSNASVALIEKKDAGGSFPAPGPFDPDPSNLIVQTDQDLELRLKWTVKGSLPLMMSGEWKCTVYLEKMGKDNDPSDGPFSETTKLVSTSSHDYELTVKIPAISNDGLYRMVAALTLAGPNKDLLPIAAFSDIGLINVYKAA